MEIVDRLFGVLEFKDLNNIDRSRIKNIYVATFGCQMNEYDSVAAVRLMAGAGYVRTDSEKQADLIFINTCSIREKAEQKIYSYLGRLRPLKEANPDLVIAVGGCVAQQQGRKLLKNAPFVDLVLGTHHVRRLPELVAETIRSRRPVCHTEFDYGFGPPPAPVIGALGPTTFLTIMQGCDNFCAYCVVPYVRGREVSRRPDEIVEEARGLLSAGVKEITLLGQNVNSYGRGLEPKVNFVDLLEKVAALPALARLRFTTSHPKDLSEGLIRAFAEIGPLCEHIHLPVQSGSAAVLAAMGRKYTPEDYLAKVDSLREVCPEIAVTTDIIVGFPGETEEDFRRTIELAERVGYDGMYSFKYSDRPGTRASRMSGKIDEEVKSQRLLELQELQKEISTARNLELVGRRVEVLVEGPSVRYPGQITGRTRNHKIVNFEGSDHLIGSLVRPLVTEAWTNSLLGRLEDDPADSLRLANHPAPKSCGC